MAGGQRGGQQRAPLPVAAEEGREGNKWVGRRPTEEEFAEWWASNVFIHEGLDPSKYAGGVVLIEQKPKLQRIVENEQTGQRSIQKFERLEFTPYSKVDTRVNYFWDLMELKGWLGVIEAVPATRVEMPGLTNTHLPQHFYRQQVESDKGWHQYIGAVMKVTVFDPDHTRIVEYVDKETGVPRQVYIGRKIIDAPAATKLVPALAYPDNPDDDAMHKAETGAVGRALGMAGILVIAGSGIATAEDVQQALADPRAAAVETEPLVTPDATEQQEGRPVEVAKRPADSKEELQALGEDELRQMLKDRARALHAASEEKYAELGKFFEAKKLGPLNAQTIDGLNPMFLRGLVKKVDTMLAEVPAPAAADVEPAGTKDVAPPAEGPSSAAPETGEPADDGTEY